MKKLVLFVSVPLFSIALVSCQNTAATNQPQDQPAPSAQQDTYGSNAYYGQQTYPQQNPYQDQGGYSDVTPAPPPSAHQNQGYGAPPPTNPGGPQSHIVEQGETLYRISKMYGTSVDGIKSANGLTSDLIHPGQVLTIP